jgi:LCP family protein required for cell wall assembly
MAVGERLRATAWQETADTMTADEGATPPLVLLRRHKAVVITFAVAFVLAASVTAYGFYLNSHLNDIGRFHSRLDARQRAPEPTGQAAKALNILLLGTDHGGSGPTIEDELADGKWTVGSFRSDTVMIVHVPADREDAYLVSIPRDSYVHIPGHGKQKINAAFSLGGPDLTVRTVEKLTDVYINHVAMIDWAGFKDLTHAIGGVEVTIAKTFTDTHNNVTWHAGTQVLEGARALQYVRTRYGLVNGDFDRIKRQQNFLRAVLRKANSTGTLSNPIKLDNLLQAVTKATTVDSRWSTGDIRQLALNLRGLGNSHMHYLTVPTRGTREVDDVGDVVLLKKHDSRALWKSLRSDDVQSYLKTYGGDTLPATDKVR